MNDYNPVDVCHYCNDRMYEYLKKKIYEKIESLENSGGERMYNDYELALLVKSLLEDK